MKTMIVLLDVEYDETKITDKTVVNSFETILNTHGEGLYSVTTKLYTMAIPEKPKVKI